ncbi:MAG TPA: hypothetical protein VGC30_09980 [Dokdonella sp.]
MSRTGWLGLALAVSLVSGLALGADPAAKDVATEARLRALEKRVSELESKASAAPSVELERRVSALEKKIGAAPAATAATAAPSLEQRVTTLERNNSAPAAAGAPARSAAASAPAGWKDAKNWAALRVGMTWSQVKQLLGVPGTVKAGVFGDVMYFPDTSGGSVEFDRDGRVSSWSRTPK